MKSEIGNEILRCDVCRARLAHSRFWSRVGQYRSTYTTLERIMQRWAEVHRAPVSAQQWSQVVVCDHCWNDWDQLAHELFAFPSLGVC